MSKVFSVGVNWVDGVVINNEYDTFEEYFEKEGINYCGYLIVDGYNCEVVESIEESVDFKKKCFDYEGGEEESDKFEKLVDKYNLFLKNNIDYILISWYVDYDNNWLLINKDDYVKLRELCEREVGIEE